MYSRWASKSIIAIDEVMLNGKHHTEKLKQLATATSINSEAKGKDKRESLYFGKLILNANDEEGFVKTDVQEMRFWVRKVKPLVNSQYRIMPNSNKAQFNEYGNPDLLHDLKNEIPAFVDYISSRKITHPKVTRMWFTKEQLHTKALDTLIKGSRSTLYDEIHFVITELFELHAVPELYYSAKDLIEILTYHGYRDVTSSRVSDTLKKEFDLVAKNSSYEKYPYLIKTNHTFNSTKKNKGRYFTFERSDFVVDLLTMENKGVISGDNPSTTE